MKLCKEFGLAWAVVAITLLFLLVQTTPARAQTRAARGGTRTQTPARKATPAETNERTREAGAETDADDADLSITAHVMASELRFEKVPNPKVEFTGSHERKTVWRADRENLPDEVQPGVTYRDIGIRLRITSVFADIERIVAEALGEIPTSDDAPRPSDVPAPPTPEQEPSAHLIPAGVTSNLTPAASPSNAPATRARQKNTRRGRRM